MAVEEKLPPSILSDFGHAEAMKLTDDMAPT
jgi:hypothetical protein